MGKSNYSYPSDNFWKSLREFFLSFDSKHLVKNTKTSGWHIEVEGDDLGATFWIQISFSEHGQEHPCIVVEKYYDSEFINDEWGKTEKYEISDTENNFPEIKLKVLAFLEEEGVSV